MGTWHAVAYTDYSSDGVAAAWGSLIVAWRPGERGWKVLQLCGRLEPEQGEVEAQLQAARHMLALGIGQAALHCDESNVATRLGIHFSGRESPCAWRAHMTANLTRQAQRSGRRNQRRLWKEALRAMAYRQQCPPGRLVDGQLTQARRARRHARCELASWIEEVEAMLSAAQASIQQEETREAVRVSSPNAPASRVSSQLHLRIEQRPGEGRHASLRRSGQEVSRLQIPSRWSRDEMLSRCRKALQQGGEDPECAEALRELLAWALSQPRAQQLGPHWPIPGTARLAGTEPGREGNGQGEDGQRQGGWKQASAG